MNARNVNFFLSLFSSQSFSAHRSQFDLISGDQRVGYKTEGAIDRSAAETNKSGA